MTIVELAEIDVLRAALISRECPLEVYGWDACPSKLASNCPKLGKCWGEYFAQNERKPVSAPSVDHDTVSTVILRPKGERNGADPCQGSPQGEIAAPGANGCANHFVDANEKACPLCPAIPRGRP